MPKDHKFFIKLQNFFSQLKFFSHPLELGEIFIFSIIIWILQITSFFIFTQAFHLDIPYTKLPFILAVTSLGIAIPSAPGGIGPFQLAFAISATIMIGLGWEANITQQFGDTFFSSVLINAQWDTYFAAILSCAIILHLCHIFAISVIGLYFFIKGNISLKEITSR